MSARGKVPPSQRFWEKVQKVEGGCWEWTASYYTSGYGQFWTGVHLTGAHRYSYILHNGEIPEDLQVLHTCDNKRCVNPGHLYAGTRSQNSQDFLQRSGYVYPVGERSSNPRLTDALVRQIRDDPRKSNHIARELGLPLSTVYWAKTYRTWKHVA